MYTNILLATDLSESHFSMCEKAVRIARNFKTKLHMLHVIELPASVQLAQGLGFTELASPSKEDAKTVMRLLGEALQIPDDQQYVEVGSVPEQVFKKVSLLGCELIIIGRHTDEGLHHPFLGSSAYSIIHHAPCDVVTIR